MLHCRTPLVFLAIAAACGGSGPTTEPPPPVSVASVAVVPGSLNLVVGQNGTLTATALSASGAPITGKTFAWSSSTPAVATVSNEGVVTAVTPGSSTVTATTDGKSGSATITVAPPPVASVTVSPATLTLDVGGTGTLTATVRDAGGVTIPGKAVTWVSSDLGVVTVNPAGLVTAFAEGTAQITASVDGVSGSATITVRVVVASVVVSPTAAALPIGGTTQLTAVPQSGSGTPLPDRPVTWSTSNPVIATVSLTGLVTAQGIGSATISASSEGKTGTALITVTTVPVASVGVTPSSPTVLAGSSVQLTATVRDSAGNPLAGRLVTWSSNSPAIAQVSATGLVTAVVPGQAVVIATSEGKSGSATITVAAAPVASVEVVPSTADVAIGEGFLLTAVLRNAAGNPLTGRSVTWTSKTPAVATVSSTGGVVTGVAIGTTTITATSEGKSGTASIRVVPVPPASMTIVPASATIVAGDILVMVAVPRDASDNPIPGRTAFWYEANGAVAHGYASHDTVVVTGISAGLDTVSATIDGTSADAHVQVTASPTNICSQIAGASVIANDGAYLGRLTNSSDTESIYNPYGAYGSPTGALSVYNRNGAYGNQYSTKSPWNPYTTAPPILTKNSSTLGFFTLNHLLSPRISPTYAEYCTFP